MNSVPTNASLSDVPQSSQTWCLRKSWLSSHILNGRERCAQSPPVSKDAVQGAGSALVLLLSEKRVEAKYDQ